jgi:DNA repair protein RecN (Recombination protein N)
MIQRIYIRNFALIRELTFEPGAQLNLLTGETGAGKSILVAAFNLLLGKRAEAGLAGNPDEKVLVEGEWLLPTHHQILFESLDLDFEPQTIVRREILPGGRSRAFVNDTPVTLEALATLMDHLLDIHSQNQNLLLRDPSFRLEMVDHFAGNQVSLQHYQQCFGALRQAKHAYDRFLAALNGLGTDPDYQQFLLDELRSAQLQAGEWLALEAESNMLAHREEIIQRLTAVQSLVEMPENGLEDQVIAVKQSLLPLKNLGRPFTEWLEGLENIQEQLRDLHRGVIKTLDLQEADPHRRQWVDQRIDALVQLQRKHKANDEAELLERLAALEQWADAHARSAEQQEILERNIQQAQEALQQAAAALTKSRVDALPGMEAELKQSLHKLNLPQARLAFVCEPTSDFSATGKDAIQLAFSANQGHPLKPIEKAASGGELARVMLALKAGLARTKSLPSIFFDEVDTGVSGQTAHMLGDVLHDMAQHLQVVVITHLPQVAAKRGQHFKVVKSQLSGRAETQLVALQPDERLMEIARLLDGDQPGQAAIDNARHLLG